MWSDDVAHSTNTHTHTLKYKSPLNLRGTKAPLWSPHSRCPRRPKIMLPELRVPVVRSFVQILPCEPTRRESSYAPPRPALDAASVVREVARFGIC